MLFFSALKSPHVRDVIVLLVKHPDFISFKDVINTLLEDKGQFLLSDNLWNPFAVDIVENIKSSLTNLKSSKLRIKRKDLCVNEDLLIAALTMTNAVKLGTYTGLWLGILVLGVLASAFLELFKRDMWHGIATEYGAVKNTVNTAFTEPAKGIMHV